MRNLFAQFHKKTQLFWLGFFVGLVYAISKGREVQISHHIPYFFKVRYFINSFLLCSSVSNLPEKKEVTVELLVSLMPLELTHMW
jgi:hypothetical protein